MSAWNKDEIFIYAPLAVDKARWYWLKPAFSAKAATQSVQQDLPHRAHILRFCSADSNALESDYRVRKDELEAAWWQEHSELALGPAAAPSPAAVAAPSNVLMLTDGSQGGKMTQTVVHVAAKKQELMDREASATSWQDYVGKRDLRADRLGLLVRSGQYEVDLLLRLMSPAYWPEAQHRVLRGTWFVEKGQDWVPLKETLADELENAYRSEIWNPAYRHMREQKQGIVAARIELSSSTNKGVYVLFASEFEIYLCRDDAYSWFSRKWGNNLAGAKLRRGYETPHAASMEVDGRQEEIDNSSAALPVNHLLLCLHGIGQNMTGANIADDSKSMSAQIRQMAMETLPEGQCPTGRVEVLPVQWRKHLKLEVDALAETLMPANLRPLRSMLHATAVEVLLYLTPLHCQEMLDSVVLSLNAVHAKFMRRNPNFTGKTSLLAHSLGSVLSWDILSAQPRLYYSLPAHNAMARQDTSLAALEAIPQPQLYGSSPPGARSGQIGPVMEAAFQPFSSEDLGPDPQSAPTASTSPLPATSNTSLSAPDPAAAPHESADSKEQQQQHVEGCTTDRGTDAASVSAASAQSIPDVRSSQQATALEAELAALKVEVAALKAERARTAAAAAAAAVAGREGSPLPDWADGRGASLGVGGATPAVTIGEVMFPIDQFLVVGSPLGLFLALRRIDPARGTGLGTRTAAGLMPGGACGGDGLPAVNRMYNLNHPYDPVAYRMEPLVVSGAQEHRPVFAAFHKGGRRIHIGLQEFGEDLSSAAGAAASRLGSNFMGVAASLKAGIQFRKAEAAAALGEPHDGDGNDEHHPEAVLEGDVDVEAQRGATSMWRLTGGRPQADGRGTAGRLDFVLQESPTENPYLSALSSHFSYWSNSDTALFVLRAVTGADVVTGEPLGSLGSAAPSSATSPSQPSAHPDASQSSLETSPTKPSAPNNSKSGSPPTSPPGKAKGTESKTVKLVPPMSPVDLVEKGWVAGLGGVLAKMKSDPKAVSSKQGDKVSVKHAKRE